MRYEKIEWECDACGRMIEKGGYMGMYRVVNNDYEKIIDLCPECMNEFTKWMAERREKRERREGRK